ncbi:MAG TPA: hypothetical protein VI895_00045 [Bdellovibrionota bacterium]|nr:hypothetical protein [Bdellovibrionota bacterium]
MKNAVARGLLSVVGTLLLADAAAATTVQSDAELAQADLFRVAKRYVLTRLPSSPSGGAKKMIKLEDASSGILRFRFQDGQYHDDAALIEVIELDQGQSKLRVTLEADYVGRAQLMMEKILQYASDTNLGFKARELPYPSPRVFQSAKRFVLKNCASGGTKKEEVIKLEFEDVGVLQFVYRDKAFTDPDAMVEITPFGDKASRLTLSLPKDPVGRRLLLEDALVKAVEDDLGEPKQGSTKVEE